MGDISNYTENALARKYTIRNYERQKKHGVIIIKYDLVDRGSGGALGLVISAPTGFGLTVVSAFLPIAAPIVAASVAVNLLALPVAGASVGAMVGIARSHSHYFDNETGELIGSTENEASERLNKMGNRLFEEGDYTEAEKYYENAYQICLSRYEKEQTFESNRNRARAEIQASNLNEEGDDLFDDGDYSEARRKYQEALDASNVSNERKVYKINKNKAQAEIDAMNLKVEGDNLFNQRNYTEASRKYQEAYTISEVYKQRKIYKENRNAAQNEIDAINLNTEGNHLFNQGNYTAALRKYEEAYNRSTVQNLRDRYTVNKNKAQTEIDAMNFNTEGENQFNQAYYSEALRKYQDAYNTSRVDKELNMYYINRNKAQAEIDAVNLNTEGNHLFSRGNYAAALRKYEDAYNRSTVKNQRDRYTVNKNKAQTEIDAMNFNTEGENQFNQAYYSEALRKYQEAYNISRVDKQLNMYCINRNKAQAEIDAINLNTEGNHLFNQGNYTEARRKYQEAYNRSSVKDQSNAYKNQIYIVSELLQLHNLWNKAWDAENDSEIDRSSEANETFLSILSKSKSALKLFPNNLKFKQFETLVLLKIEGNNLFNQGINLQQSGLKLLREAQYLEEQQKYELADIKFEEAKTAFCSAKKKFLEGSKTDERFVSCAEIVQDHIEQVVSSIRNIEIQQRLRNSSDDINSDMYIFSLSSESVECVGNSNCYAQI